MSKFFNTRVATPSLATENNEIPVSSGLARTKLAIRSIWNTKPRVSAFKEVGTLVVGDFHTFKEISKRDNVKIHCDNYMGSPIDFTPTSITVARYHKGIFLPTYSHIAECEKDVLALPHLSVQAGDFFDEDKYKEFTKMLKLTFRNGLNKTFNDEEWILGQIEALAMVIHWSKKCTTLHDYYVIASTSYRLFTGRSAARDLLNKLFPQPSDIQYGGSVDDVLKTLRSAFDLQNTVSESPLIKKMVQVYSHLLTQGYLARFGIEITDEDYSKMEQRALVSAFSSKRSFFLCVLDTTLTIFEKLSEYRKCGDISVFVQSSSAYSEWLKEADRIIQLANFTSNLGAHGTSFFAYNNDLNAAIEKGESYCKYLSANMGDVKIFRSKVASLTLIKNTLITKNAAQQEREAPASILIAGASSVAKSMFSKMVYMYFASLNDLPNDDCYRYVRNPMDEYYSNFDSSKWCIHLDDIAFLHPAKCTDVDATLKDLLNIVGNIPYCPPQAAIEDKGKTPVLAKLVSATTNCIDLNANEYFWCPLAIRRRLPYIVNIVPKKEFMHENKVFIDPKVLVSESGKYPDWWEIEVFELVPVFSQGRTNAKLERVAVFSDINLFFQHFGKHCIQHFKNQANAMAKDKDIATIKTCKECLMPLPHDGCLNLQSGEVGLFTGFLLLFFQWCFTWSWYVKILQIGARWRASRWLVMYIINLYMPQTMIANFCANVCAIHQDPRIKRALLCIGLIGLGLAAYNYARPSIASPKKEEDKEEKVIEEKPVESTLPLQGNIAGTTEDQLTKESSANVWYNPTIELSRFDVPDASASLAGADPARVRDILGTNCVQLRIRVIGASSYRLMRGVFIKGHICMTNGHAFSHPGARYTVTVIKSPMNQGITSNITFEMNHNSVEFHKDIDACVFLVKCLPPFKDITPFWNTREIFPSMAVELVRRDTELAIRQVYSLNLFRDMMIPELCMNCDVYMGTATEDTAEGDCGSLAIAITPRGPIILGLHLLGRNTSCGILKVSKGDVEHLCKEIHPDPVVQGGGAPDMVCSKRTYVLTEPHHKSLFRYLKTGQLNFYGSFAGFRPKPKSKVCATPLQKVFLEHYKRDVEYGPPPMTGWAPWRNNVIQMVEPTVNYDANILDDAVDMFINDITTQLPAGWEGELVFLSNEAAVNGLPGVKFIDAITKNTSMGFPFSCSKKSFLFESKSEKYPDGVDFVPEVWDKVEQIEALYKQGKRAYPVFNNHMKDEALAHAKILAQKIRLFSAGPTAWGLVVRKNLLSFVRLLQKNPFIFEAGPGTVCQSKAWGKIRKHLTAFGPHRMVGGDFKGFDKKIISDFILAAFRVILGVFKAAGYTNDELIQIACIAEDIAFPVSNVNGDLVEFFGTNPSGHPLTVIINSLVNSLYMRYCYMKLNPLKECSSFQDNVHLFTYGDDNIMGVDEDASFFNHCSIQETLKDIGVTYTMADKTSESVPFIHIDNCSFLKRQWVWNEEMQEWMAPLEEDSIIKSLTVWVPSGSIDKYAQMQEVVKSAVNEYFFYGREVFDKKKAFFQQVLEQEPYNLYVRESTFPSYDSLVERFHKASEPSSIVEIDNSDQSN